MAALHRRAQRRARRAALAVALAIVAVGAPLLLLPNERLELGQRLGWVPGREASRLFGPSAPVELIVLTEEVPAAAGLTSRRYTAAAVAERTGEAVLLHDLGGERWTEVPLAGYDLIAASADRRVLLFVDRTGGEQAQAVAVDLASGVVDPLPPGTTDPGIPGAWDTDVADTAHIDCSGVSPGGRWVACIRRPSSPYLYGDWELQVHPYGRARERLALYRGRGSDPLVGWAADESALFFQNETGVWRVPFPSAPLP